MTKFILVDANNIEESILHTAAEETFDRAMDLVNEHGVCYFRFTRESGMEILNPKLNSRINGAISDA